MKLLRTKPYACLACLGAALLFANEWICNDTLFTIAILFMFWGIFGDIASKLYVVKITDPGEGFKIESNFILNANEETIKHVFKTAKKRS